MRKKMRFLSAALLLALSFDATVNAQTIKPKPVDKLQVVNPKAEIINSSEKIVKGAPFSAEAVSESVQILFDGNRIVQRSSARLYRDGEGRFRRDDLPKPVALGSFVELPQVIFILDPVASLKFYLYPESKTARQSALKNGRNDRQKMFEKSDRDLDDAEREIARAEREIERAERAYEKTLRELEKQKSAADAQERKKIEQEIGRIKQQIETRKTELESRKQELKKRKQSIESQKPSTEKPSTEKPSTEKPSTEKPSKTSEKQITRQSQSESSSSVTENEKPAKVATESKIFKTETKPNPSKLAAKPIAPNAPSLPVLPKGEVRNEALGTRTLEGVEAEGVRQTTVVAAGAIGNERPLEITYERWYSKELELIVFSKYVDPRFGEQTYRLTNIRRAEPDSALFTPPADYKIIDEPGKKRMFPEMKPPRIPVPRKKTAGI